jgi:hypothetical protein
LGWPSPGPGGDWLLRNTPYGYVEGNPTVTRLPGGSFVLSNADPGIGSPAPFPRRRLVGSSTVRSLSLVEEQVFGAAVVRRVMQHLAALLASTGSTATTDRAGLEAAANKLERQQQHLVAAIADGDTSRSLRAKLAEVEQQQTAIADRLQRLSALVSLEGRDLAQFEAAAWAVVMRGWRGIPSRRGPSSRSSSRGGSASSRRGTPSGSRRRHRQCSSSARSFRPSSRHPGGMSRIGGGPNGIRTRV